MSYKFSKNAICHFMLLCYLLIFMVSAAKGDTCIAHDVCSCKRNGKDMVSLRPLDLSNGIKFTLTQKSGEFIHYNPCTPFAQQHYCHDTLACQYPKNKDKRYTYGLADPKTHVFSVNEKGNVVFQYSHLGHDNKKRILHVNLSCDHSADEPRHTIVEETGTIPITYSFTLTTKCACPNVCSSDATPADKRISLGSILLILLFVGLLVYFVAGFLFLKFYKKNEGLDAIPHREFWSDLPAKVKDGCTFTWKRIRKKDSEYEQI